MMDTLKSRIRTAVGEDRKYVDGYTEEATGKHVDGYREKIVRLHDRLNALNGEKEVHPIEITYSRDLMEGMKPSLAALKRKERYRAAVQRRQMAAQRGLDAQHRDRELLQQICGLSRHDLYQTDVIDQAIENCTEVVGPTGTVITSDYSREVNAINLQCKLPTGLSCRT